mgnify:CR=1 FL=1
MFTQNLSRDIVLDVNNPLITHATVVAKLVPNSPEDHMKLVRLVWSFRRVTELMVREVMNGSSVKEAAKKLHNILPNYVYLESAYKHAKLIVGGSRINNGNPKHIHLRRLFIVSQGNKYDRGNRNIKLKPRDNYFETLIRYPWDGSWIICRAFFGERYVPMIRELVELARKKVDGYGARIVFRSGRVELHLSVPLYLYVKYLGLPRRNGYGLIVGFDLNSDRINMVMIDGDGRIVSLKSKMFPEVTLHGFPRNKAKDIRLRSLKELLKYARNIGVDYVVFENLFIIKKRGRVRSPSGNRRIAHFAKRQLLMHGIIASMRLGLTPVLVDPRGTTRSEEHDKVMKERGLDRHMASAYIIAHRGLKVIKNHENFR